MSAREVMPRFVAPMLLKSTPEPPRAAAWALEVKWDGWRAQLSVDGDAVELRTRSGRLITAQFPEVAAIAAATPARVILDAELVCLDGDGMPDFDRVRRRGQAQRASTIAAAAATTPARVVLFDVLHLDGSSTCGLAYARRRELLQDLALDGPAWATPRWFAADEHDLAAATRTAGLEGIVAKRLDAPYAPGRRSPAALKIKHWRRERLYVSGARVVDGHDAYYLRYPDGRHAGEVQHGLAPFDRADLRARIRAAAVDRPRRGVRNVAPGVVLVDVDHHGRPGGALRDPVLRAVVPRG